MTKRGLIWTVIIWGILTLLNYYYFIWIIVAIVWLGLSLTLFIQTITQIVKTIKERRALTRLRITKLLTFTLLFILTAFRYINLAIEKVDWLILQNKRIEIVEQVKNKVLNPNASWNGWVCQLPFDFPVVSNGGNDIGIDRNKENNKTTVTFWVFRNFFDDPSTYFIYTDDPGEISRLDYKVSAQPSDNWKIKENWYRIYGE